MIEVKLRGTYPDTKLYARKIWQELFNLYRAGNGDLDNLDNLLIDLQILCEHFDKYKSFQFYWTFYRNTTNVRYYFDGDCEQQYLISYDLDKHIITIKDTIGMECGELCLQP